MSDNDLKEPLLGVCIFKKNHMQENKRPSTKKKSAPPKFTQSGPRFLEAASPNMPRGRLINEKVYDTGASNIVTEDQHESDHTDGKITHINSTKSIAKE